MIRVVVTAEAEADIAEIVEYLREAAGPGVASEYEERFESALKRLAAFPNSGSPRDDVDLGIRMVVVYPYLIFHEVAADASIVTVLRVLHGRVELEDKF